MGWLICGLIEWMYDRLEVVPYRGVLLGGADAGKRCCYCDVMFIVQL